MLADELANARLVEASSIFEWRLRPQRLTAELAAFLAEPSDPQRGPERSVVG
jgi:hypothetical protein